MREFPRCEIALSCGPMKLIGSKTSPYVRKVRVLLAEKKLPYEFVEENVWSADHARCRATTRSTRCRCWCSTTATDLYDSSVITEYLDALAGAGAAFPPAGSSARSCGAASRSPTASAMRRSRIVLERKREAAAPGSAAWIARQLRKVDAGIAALRRGAGRSRPGSDGSAPGRSPTSPRGCALFYVEFRLPEVGWRARHREPAGAGPSAWRRGPRSPRPGRRRLSAQAITPPPRHSSPR